MVRRARRCTGQWLLAVACAVAAAPAGATWSIVAVDPTTREVGIAGASCIGGTEAIGRVVPDRGAIAAQALTNGGARDFGARRLDTGDSPGAVIEAVTSKRFDGYGVFPLARLRQYGVVALDSGEAAAFTGRWTLSARGDVQARGVSVQGNILRDAGVLEASLAAFGPDAPPCSRPLAARLLAALEAGAKAGGDRRCTRRQTALSAFLTVARPDDPPEAPTVHLVVPEQSEGGPNPVVLLRRQYDRWRRENPPPPPGACEDDVP